MAPTTYGDLGKSARDVIGKGYHFSLLKLELKTKTASGVEFTSGKYLKNALHYLRKSNILLNHLVSDSK